MKTKGTRKRLLRSRAMTNQCWTGIREELRKNRCLRLKVNQLKSKTATEEYGRFTIFLEFFYERSTFRD